MSPISARLFVSDYIAPALDHLDLGGRAAKELLLGTSIQETGLRNIRQQHGPALGYFQIEPATHDDVWSNFLRYRPALAHLTAGLLPPDVPPHCDPDIIMAYPIYAAAIARLVYYRCPEPLPAAGDLAAQAAYYKAHYNTAGGGGTAAEYIANWKAMVGEQTIV